MEEFPSVPLGSTTRANDPRPHRVQVTSKTSGTDGSKSCFADGIALAFHNLRARVFAWVPQRHLDRWQILDTDTLCRVICHNLPLLCLGIMFIVAYCNSVFAAVDHAVRHQGDPLGHGPSSDDARQNTPGIPACNISSIQNMWLRQLKTDCFFGTGTEDGNKFKFRSTIWEVQDAEFTFPTPGWILYNETYVINAKPPTCTNISTVAGIVYRTARGGRFEKSALVRDAEALCGAYFLAQLAEQNANQTGSAESSQAA